MKAKSYTVIEDETLWGLADKLNNYFKDHNINVLFVTEVQEVEPVNTYTSFGSVQKQVYKKKYIALVEVIEEVEG